MRADVKDKQADKNKRFGRTRTDADAKGGQCYRKLREGQLEFDGEAGTMNIQWQDNSIDYMALRTKFSACLSSDVIH